MHRLAVVSLSLGVELSSLLSAPELLGAHFPLKLRMSGSEGARVGAFL